MIAGRFFRKNFDTFPVEDFSDPFTAGELCIYEVVRTDDGIPLFLEDHIERLTKSFSISGKAPGIDPEKLKHEILLLTRLNEIKNGLIRIVFCFYGSEADIYLFNNKVRFPSADDYTNGVVCELMPAERSNPEAKVYIPSVRERANEIISRHKVYETILVNSQNRITEGSRSNIFFLKNDTIITAPDDAVLHGITRKKVIEIIHEQAIPFRYDLLKVSELAETDSAFLTGTTPKVLPVNRINHLKFNISHPLIAAISDGYNRMIGEYKKSFRF